MENVEAVTGWTLVGGVMEFLVVAKMDSSNFHDISWRKNTREKIAGVTRKKIGVVQFYFRPREEIPALLELLLKFISL